MYINNNILRVACVQNNMISCKRAVLYILYYYFLLCRCRFYNCCLISCLHYANRPRMCNFDFVAAAAAAADTCGAPTIIFYAAAASDRDNNNILTGVWRAVQYYYCILHHIIISLRYCIR